MRIHITLLAVLSGMMACAPAADQETQQVLGAYTHFVDSVYALNESWNSGIDSSFVEVPLDPNDPAKVRIDTVVTTPENRTTKNQYYTLFKETLHQEYDPLKASVEAHLGKMDEQMKKSYQQSAEKFETITQP